MRCKTRRIMKKHKGLLIVLAVTIIAFLIVFTAFMNSDATQNNIFDDNDVTAGAVVSGTESVEDTEYLEETETEEVELSYIELYGLEEVDKPEKRTEEQVLQKLEELSKKHELVRQVYENADAYSKGMLDHLANNPEMAAFVLGSLEADGSVTGGFTEKELEQDFPLLLQYDPRWGYFEYGGSTSILFLNNNVVIDNDIIEQNKNGYEVKVDIGEKIGRICS